MQEMKSLNGFKLVDVDGRQLVREAEGRANSKISKVSKRITNLENGYGEDLFTTDATSAHQKTVPENALPYAEIKKVYGQGAMVNGVATPLKVVRIESYGRETRKPLDVTLISSSIDYYMTAEKLEDGSIKFNGNTCSGSAEKSSAFATINLPEDGKYCLYYTVVSNTSSAEIMFSIDEEYNFSPGMYPHFDPNVSYGMAHSGPHTFYVYLNDDYGNSPVAEDLIVRFEVLKAEWGADSYSPDYKGALCSEPLDTLEIPEEVTSLEWYGWQNNYIDFERGVFVCALHRVNGSNVTIDPPEEIDIRQHIGYDNFIEVVPDGKLRFVDDADSNINKRSEVTYMLKGE